MADGAVVSVSGTLTGPRHAERLVEVNGYAMEIAPTAHMGFFTYTDRPGIVGVVGRLLGDAGINIAGMQVGRHEKGGKALIALTVDSASRPGPDRRDRGGDRRGAGTARRPGGLTSHFTLRISLSGISDREARHPCRARGSVVVTMRRYVFILSSRGGA